MRKIIALTGNRASGKGTVCRVFKSIGYKVFNADLCLKFLLNFDLDIINEAQSQLGQNSLMGGFYNYAFFDSDDKMKRLIGVAIPKLMNTFIKWLDKQDENQDLIFVCSCLFEAELENHEIFDSVVSVFCPQEVREERIEKYLGSDRIGMLDSEMNEYEKNSKSDHIIHNYDGFSISTQVENVDELIKEQLAG